MRLLSTILCLSIFAGATHAGVEEALDDHILPNLAKFTEQAETLAEVATRDCRAAALRAPFHRTFDAWMAVGDIRMGPSETGALSIAFWPDPRGSTQRTLSRMISQKDPVAEDVEAYAEVSIAARGLFALEMVIFDPAFADYPEGGYTCRLVVTIARDLDRQAQELATNWRDNYARTLRSAGAHGNTEFLAEDEARRALFTQILSSIEFTVDQRLGRPLGTVERPRPALAEARRSGRSLRNVVIAVEAAHSLATKLANRDLPRTNSAIEAVRKAASRIDQPAFQDIADPQKRLRVEALQQSVHRARVAIEAEVGKPLGIAAGFNAMDGD